MDSIVSFLCVIIIMITIYCAYLLQKIKQLHDIISQNNINIAINQATVNELDEMNEAYKRSIYANYKRIRGDTALRRENRCKKIMNSI